MNYQNRFVIFIDILGFKEIITSTTDKEGNDVLEAITSIINAMKLTSQLYNDGDELQNDFTKSKRVTQFSDSIVVSFEIGKLEDVFIAIEKTKLLILELVYKGFLCRGGMALGKLLHTDEYLFGPALVEAYELENKAAIYPRVIVNEDSLYDALKTFAQKKGSITKNDIIDFQEIEKLFVKDFDGHFYLDYIIDSFTHIDYGLYEKYYAHLESVIKAGLSLKNQSAKTKYYWMREKYNQFVKNAKSFRSIKQIKAGKDKKLLAFCKSLKPL